jgi:hypothetical protein
MTVSLIEPDVSAMLSIASRMRDLDREEIMATRDDESVVLLAEQAAGTGALRWAFAVDGRPVCAMGAVPLWRGSYSVWMFATDDFDRVSLAVTKHAVRVMMPAMLARGLSRASCATLDRHVTAHAWLASLGGQYETDMPGYGKNGETFFLYAWSRDDVLSRTVRWR